jgi:putative hemolysin
MQTSEPLPGLNLASFLDPPALLLTAPVAPAIERLLMLDRLRDAFAASLRHAAGDEFEALLAELGVRYHLHPDDLGRIPAGGPLVIVANHPFGMLEAAVLAVVLARARPDVKFMANSILAAIPQVRDRFILVNPFGGRAATAENRIPLRRAIEWLRGGGALAVFPAGEVARFNLTRGAAADRRWNPSVGRLIRMAGCPALPVFFEGSNSLSFQLLGMVHPLLGTAALPRELLNKRGSLVELRIGRPVSADTLAGLASAEAAMLYLRCRTDMLASRGLRPSEPRRIPISLPLPAPKPAPPVPVASETAPALVAEEVARLDARDRLCGQGEFEVYIAAGERIPSVLREIGRLRELTFRAVGEGSGRALDLDAYDESYLHLFLWNRDKREIAGAYRLCATPDVLPRRGIRGLYTASLFHYRPEFFRRVGPALELGRSFVRPEYQRQIAPLFLLWKGIGHYVAARLDCPTLFGAVSVSNDYNPVSRDLLVSFLKRHTDPGLARLVRPKRPFHPASASKWHAQVLSRFLTGLEDLTDPIADLEPDGKGVPVLIRQYMKLGGRLLGFNVDAKFSNALDGLMLVDLRTTPLAKLSRYMPPAGAARFLDWHRVRCA